VEKSARATSSALFARNKYHEVHDHRGPQEDRSHSKDRGPCRRNATKDDNDSRGNWGNHEGRHGDLMENSELNGAMVGRVCINEGATSVGRMGT
jgi:hypothetical protein